MTLEVSKTQPKKIGNLIVFNNGVVFREKKNKCYLVNFTITKKGYATVKLNNKMVYIHRLVMKLFKGESDLTVDHIDGDKLNNSIENLEYVTNKENIRRAYNNGIHKKHSEQMSKKVLWNNKIFKSAKELSLYVGCHPKTASGTIIRDGKLKGYKPKYIKDECND